LARAPEENARKNYATFSENFWIAGYLCNDHRQRQRDCRYHYGPLIPEAAGERRHVTVMFCDLVDSTGIAAKLDAEEWRDLVGAYLDAASAAVAEMTGKVTKKLGDGLMALFGYPVAQENDAERGATMDALRLL
jgi:class 3 adenylate cyclase